MCEEKQEKILYMVTQGNTESELVSLAFMHAIGALVMDVEAVIVLMGDATWIAKKGIAEHVHSAGKSPLNELIASFREQGGKMLACTPCVKDRKIETSDMIEGVELVSAAAFTEEVLSATNTLCY